MDTDKVARSINEARQLVQEAYDSHKILEQFDQGKIDKIVEAMAKAAYDNSQNLARMAAEETRMGVFEHKIIKNQFGSKNVYESIKDLKTAGIIREDKVRKVVEIAEPFGVVLGIIPTTNPTSTVMFKAIVALKARNTIVFSPHPRAVRCCVETARILEEAAVAAGAPRGVIRCMSNCTKEATQELMENPNVSVILATGGAGMVKAAYSSGKPAYGVGPGNVPAFIERSANIKNAVKCVIGSKTFDNGTICASEQAVITEKVIAEQVIREMMKQGAYFVRQEDVPALERTVIAPQGGVNPEVVGQSPQFIAQKAGIKIPESTKVLVAPIQGVGKEFPLSAEKLCPVLAFYVVNNWVEACELSFKLLEYGGLGHSLVIHSKNESVIREFALKKPVFRILVNTPSSQGAIGYTTGLTPSLTLGCGSRGGNITSDNVGPLHLLNIKRLAYNLDDSFEERQDDVKFSYRYTKSEVIKAVEDYLKSKNIV